MIKNNAEFTGLDLTSIFKNDLVNISTDDKFVGVSTDTREIENNNIFVAIKGDSIDAHTKVHEAFEKGATAALVNREWFKNNDNESSGKKYILVDNTIEGLSEIASYHRDRFDYPVVAVGGSNGKTSTKDLIAHVLKKKYNVLKTYKNFNNQIGLPLMLLQMTKDHGVAVLEFGTNMPGEISILSEMARPTHGLITNIGKEHLEQLIDIQGVEMEETFLFGYLRAKGFCLINLDDERLSKYTPILEKFATYGTVEDSQTKGEITLDEELAPTVTIANGEGKFTAKMKTFGYHSGFNAIAASCVGFLLDIEHKLVKEALESYEPDTSAKYGRMLMQKQKDIFIINDCYNSNPGSLEVALKNLIEFKNEGRKIAVLGDMLELGNSSYEEHLEAIKSYLPKVDLLITTGEEFRKANSQFEKGKLVFFDEKNKLNEFLLEFIKPNDLILIKGSRGIKLEETVEYLKSNY